MVKARAVQLGTAFICCDESGANEVYKRALIEGHFQETVLTKTFTGRLARGLSNEFRGTVRKMRIYSDKEIPN